MQKVYEVTSGGIVAIPIVLQNCDLLMLYSGQLQFDSSVLSIEVFEGQEGFTFNGDLQGNFVAVTPKVETRSGTITVGYVIFRAKAGLKSAETHTVSVTNIKALSGTNPTISPEMYEAIINVMPSETDPILLGDVNGDGEVTLADAILTLQYLSGNRELTKDELIRADVNGDGRVTAEDATLIMQMCL